MSCKTKREWKLRTPLVNRVWTPADFRNYFHLTYNQYKYLKNVHFPRLSINLKRPWVTRERLTDLILLTSRWSLATYNYAPDDLEITLGCLFNRLSSGYCGRNIYLEKQVVVMQCPSPIFKWDADHADRQYHGSYVE